MRTTISLDEALLDEAQRLTGPKERAALIREG
ncbi:MAG TPA: type II toxin-antitoxin system VapB family antitoxin, partial [Chloroflexota bacterium]|nr:type II toxin-antitoxin system VapB family antitoxin [Chloroflexota bacterium]